MSTLPKEVNEYLHNELIGCQNPVFIKVSENGKFISYNGNYETYGFPIPEHGSQIEDNIPFVDGLFPFKANRLILPNIQTFSGLYADIHIFKIENSCWIVLLDNTNEVDKIREIIQKQNETQLMLQQSKKKLESTIQIDVLQLFNVFAFEKTENDQFQLIGKNCGWLKDLFPKENFTQKFDISSYFPFIETYLPIAENLWQTESFIRVTSNKWTESDSEGKYFHLQAFAAKIKNRKFLFLELMNSSVDENQELIQKAREKSLAYEQLSKAEAALKRLLKFKDHFVSIVSHDLRSPISAVVALSEIMINDDKFMSSIDNEYKVFLNDIFMELNRLLEYNSKLYHWSNLELGKFQVYSKQLNLNELIKISHKNLVHKLNAKNINFSININQSFFINADEALISQVFNNLIGNAVKFTPENGTISVTAERTENLTFIKVSDTGVGIKPEVQKKLFSDNFDKSSDGTGGEKGTGLGLSICKKIIDAHGFEIHVESELGKGTSFIIEIEENL